MHWDKVDAVASPLNILGVMSVILIGIQIFVIYFHAAIGKLAVTEWSNGNAIYYWFNHGAFGMPLWLIYITTPLLRNAFFVSSLTYGSIFLEVML